MAANQVSYKNLFQSLGKSGEQLTTSYLKEELRVDDIRLEDYRRMLNNDGQIQMLMNAICNTIISAGVIIEEDPEWEDEKNDSEEKTFIETNLLRSSWQNGMSRSLDLTNRTMLRAFIESYRLFEVVYRMGEDGKIYLDKLAPRSGQSDEEIHIVIDDNGNFKGFRQRVAWFNKMEPVEILNDSEIKKALKVTYGEEYGSLYGRSGLKSAWYHYDKVHKAMFLNHVGHELGAVKFRHVKTKAGITVDQTSKIVNTLEKVHQDSVAAIPEAQAELIFESVSDAAVMAVGKTMIDLHYSLIAKSILAQFIDLGSTTSETGSRALGESQTDFFKEGLQSIATILIENPWNEIIADIIRLNFNSGIIPRLKVNKINDRTAESLLALFTKMVEKGEVTESIKAAILTRGGNTLGMELKEEDLTKELAQVKADQVKQDNQKMQLLAKSKSSKATQLEETAGPIEMPYRELYPDEQKVRLVDIKRELVNVENRATSILSDKLMKVKQRVVDSYIQAARNGFKSIKRVKVELAENTYSEELYNLANGIMEFGKIGASNEMNISVPTTTKADRLKLQNDVDVAVEDQTLRLKLRLQGVAQNALTANMPENDLQILLDQEFDDFFNKVLSPTVHALVPQSLNFGRGISFGANSGNIFAYRYTAVLDDRTTEYCRSLDGKVFQASDPDFYMLTPPNHFGCRSIWTPILNTESAGIRVDGKPLDIPVYGSLNSFQDVSMHDVINQIDKVLNI